MMVHWYGNIAHGLEDVFAVKLAQKHGNEDDTHTPAFLDDNGDVWVWGYNGYGECGDGRTQNCYDQKEYQENGLMTRRL